MKKVGGVTGICVFMITHKNPGPCGAGACLFLPNEERVDLKQPVSTRSSILLGELIAIKIALESIKLEMEKLCCLLADSCMLLLITAHAL